MENEDTQLDHYYHIFNLICFLCFFVFLENGHSTQNGHISQNGQSSQNGHSSRNGHSSQNGTVMKLFTPGPLETTISVREALLTDYGSRSDEMISIIKFIREKLVVFAGK